MTYQVYNVLFLRAGNSARSVLGEMLLNTNSEGCFRAQSAGYQPKRDVHPLAIKEAETCGRPTQNLTAIDHMALQIKQKEIGAMAGNTYSKSENS
ncbi:hypothetical protein [Brucella rhizosphaerae]|uniref:hypothetical protein n=1 Tax=Brucella rhizosphaerae TaxID=571254 RepID=UPI000B9992CF|nr:hypothetical protein [Brucella rhizosphaerae]